MNIGKSISFLSLLCVGYLLYPDLREFLWSNIGGLSIDKDQNISKTENEKIASPFSEDLGNEVFVTCTTDVINSFNIGTYSWFLSSTPGNYFEDYDYLLSHQSMIILIITAGIAGFIFGRLMNLYNTSALSPTSSQGETPSSFFEGEETIDRTPEDFGLDDKCLCYEEEFEKDIKAMIDNSNFNKNFYDHDLIETKRIDEIYTAKHVLDKQIYVIKKIPIKVDKNKKLLENEIFREISCLKSINSKYIARYLTSWLEESECFSNSINKKKLLLCIQTEAYTYKNLKEWLDLGIQNKKPCYKIFKQLVKGLKNIHEHNLCHGNLKTKNVFLNRSKNVKISNFRLGKLGENCVKAGQKKDIINLASILIELFVIFHSKEDRKVALQRFHDELVIPVELKEDYEEVYDIVMQMISSSERKELLNDILAKPIIFNAL
ncbi:hypothetical protein SteCoe_31483 [Stentor coeruleus]|uniref:non-specific serine/threonine protein kinase n=1 Tax=Stentor coeruleus TaxID=5963 RepID=A0A1R2B184_9CILI|nr:hypothetical protein SteCoe_31483 [Stentor coeruleus]